jgi:hypothetical protein
MVWRPASSPVGTVPGLGDHGSDAPQRRFADQTSHLQVSPNVRSGKMIGRQLSCCRYRAVEATAVVATQSQYRRQHPQEVWT